MNTSMVHDLNKSVMNRSQMTTDRIKDFEHCHRLKDLEIKHSQITIT